jgi:hypothetical protein
VLTVDVQYDEVSAEDLTLPRRGKKSRGRIV